MKFDSDIYRRNSIDLRDMDDRQLREHFLNHGKREHRIFASVHTTIERMSMRWLRGRGIEVGAGRNPTPLFGETECVYADISTTSAYGGGAEHVLDLNYTPVHTFGEFDFVIAAHVLEHCDSFITGVANLLSAVNRQGVVLIVLPDKRYLHDRLWLPDYDFQHHLEEWRDPLINAEMHDRLFLNAFTTNVRLNEHAEFSEEVAAAFESGHMPRQQRFLSHKHNYDFSGWIRLVDWSLETLKCEFRIQDCAHGAERMDCHLVLTR
jgi:hypothetical protein